jgi:hypothetical protein
MCTTTKKKGRKQKYGKKGTGKNYRQKSKVWRKYGKIVREKKVREQSTGTKVREKNLNMNTIKHEQN